MSNPGEDTQVKAERMCDALTRLQDAYRDLAIGQGIGRPTDVQAPSDGPWTRAARRRAAARKAWHRRRRLVLAAYGGRCCECGTADALQLHHLNGTGESERERRRAPPGRRQ